MTQILITRKKIYSESFQKVLFLWQLTSRVCQTYYQISIHSQNKKYIQCFFCVSLFQLGTRTHRKYQDHANSLIHIIYNLKVMIYSCNTQVQLLPIYTITYVTYKHMFLHQLFIHLNAIFGSLGTTICINRLKGLNFTLFLAIICYNTRQRSLIQIWLQEGRQKKKFIARVIDIAYTYSLLILVLPWRLKGTISVNSLQNGT